MNNRLTLNPLGITRCRAPTWLDNACQVHSWYFRSFLWLVVQYFCQKDNRHQARVFFFKNISWLKKTIRIAWIDHCGSICTGFLPLWFYCETLKATRCWSTRHSVLFILRLFWLFYWFQLIFPSIIWPRAELLESSGCTQMNWMDWTKCVIELWYNSY